MHDEVDEVKMLHDNQDDELIDDLIDELNHHDDESILIAWAHMVVMLVEHYDIECLCGIHILTMQCQLLDDDDIIDDDEICVMVIVIQIMFIDDEVVDIYDESQIE